MWGFQDILGQEPIKAYIKHALERGQISHAYIIAGEKGMGKKLLAESLAMALLCDEGHGEACGTCHSCLQFVTGNHPDVTRVTHEKASIGVDEIRAQLVDPMLIKPYHSRYKVYIVDEAELLTVQAQNALLKTIEEPPEYGVVMLLSANPDSFLQTIRSRCTMLKMMPLPGAQIQEVLLQRGVPTEQAERCAAFAGGNLGKAIELSGSEAFGQMYDLLTQMLSRIAGMELSEIMAFIKELKDQELDGTEVLDFIELWYRDVLFYKATGAGDRLVFSGEKDVIRALSQKIGYPQAERILTEIGRARTRLASNVNMETTMELVLLAMKEQ